MGKSFSEFIKNLFSLLEKEKRNQIGEEASFHLVLQAFPPLGAGQATPCIAYLPLHLEAFLESFSQRPLVEQSATLISLSDILDFYTNPRRFSVSLTQKVREFTIGNEVQVTNLELLRYALKAQMVLSVLHLDRDSLRALRGAFIIEAILTFAKKTIYSTQAAAQLSGYIKAFKDSILTKTRAQLIALQAEIQLRSETLLDPSMGGGFEGLPCKRESIGEALYFFINTIDEILPYIGPAHLESEVRPPAMPAAAAASTHPFASQQVVPPSVRDTASLEFK